MRRECSIGGGGFQAGNQDKPINEPNSSLWRQQKQQP